jgi:hypothetical protein
MSLRVGIAGQCERCHRRRDEATKHLELNDNSDCISVCFDDMEPQGLTVHSRDLLSASPLYPTPQLSEMQIHLLRLQHGLNRWIERAQLKK